MTFRRRLATLLGAVALAATLAAPAAQAAGPEVVGDGTVRAPKPGAAFSVEMDDTHPLAFTYWDFSSDPPRTLTMAGPATADCLGELFGGQTLRLTGDGQDSASPGEMITLQLFLVDGGFTGPDRLSLKATRADDSVVYFAPLRDVESGTLNVSCSGGG